MVHESQQEYEVMPALWLSSFNLAQITDCEWQVRCMHVTEDLDGKNARIHTSKVDRQNADVHCLRFTPRKEKATGHELGFTYTI